MNLIKYILIMVILIVNNQGYSMGIGDWREETKNGTLFDDPGRGVTIRLENGKTYQYLSTWYFYKDYIIGIKRGGIQEKSYYAINELESMILEFEDDESWKEFIQTNDLSPFFWTRWYKDNWNHMRIVLLWGMIASPIIILILLVRLINWGRGKQLKSNNWKYFLSSILAIISLIYILSEFPNSI